MLWASKRPSKTRSVLNLIIFLRANQKETSYQLYDDSTVSKYAWLKRNECSVESANMCSYQVWLTSGGTFYHYINVIEFKFLWGLGPNEFCRRWQVFLTEVRSLDTFITLGVHNIHLVEIESSAGNRQTNAFGTLHMLLWRKGDEVKSKVFYDIPSAIEDVMCDCNGKHEGGDGSQAHTVLSLLELSPNSGLLPPGCRDIELPCGSQSLLVRNAYKEMNKILQSMNEEYQERFSTLTDFNGIPGRITPSGRRDRKFYMSPWSWEEVVSAAG